MTDSSTPSISIMNTPSLLKLERETGWSIDKARFRSNIWYDGGAAWKERSWMGETLNFGSCQVRITEEIVRCAAVDIDPYDGFRNLSVLKALGQQSSNVTFDVLGVVEDGGALCSW